ncbi:MULTISPECIES: YgjV family protein [Ferrimonas]|uniref:YgjV family protein n=1 Tax=Ferrimonas TaxID=44011 RepID=UPI0004223013|nr:MULTISPECIES: YgjV family protein [Ferrimonas]USD35863.1 YgjV family protein [Ferrimonas sp. SCSIO 43195]
MSTYLLSQCLVAVAIVLDLCSFQFRQRHWVLRCLCLSTLLTAIHFALLGHWTGALLMALACVRFAVSLITTRPFWCWVFLLLTLPLTLLSWAGLPSLLSATGSALQTLSAFQRDDKRLRLGMIAGISFWLAHNIVVGSPMAIAMETLFITSNLIGLWRFHRPSQFSVFRRQSPTLAPPRE